MAQYAVVIRRYVFFLLVIVASVCSVAGTGESERLSEMRSLYASSMVGKRTEHHAYRGMNAGERISGDWRRKG